jgi:N-methylhydantoinase B
MGGTQHGDGADAISTGTSNAMNIPVEAIEIDYPIRIRRYEMASGSGGSGRYRGGLGIVREYEMLAESASINVRGDRANFPPQGVHGGLDGTKSHYQLFEDGSKDGQDIPSKYSGVIKQHGRLRVTTPGGGGYGPPGGRDRTLIDNDVRNEKVPAAKLREDHGIDAERK